MVQTSTKLIHLGSQKLWKYFLGWVGISFVLMNYLPLFDVWLFPFVSEILLEIVQNIGFGTFENLYSIYSNFPFILF